ncbi:glycosyltransferase family 4 protein [candidate division WOR-3 bacterium]|nr:glycosyltransferase family 4 protein [candidate division WOR-3 bacterium]
MKIAYDMTNPYSPGATGIGTYAKSLAESMIFLHPENRYFLCVRDSRLKKIIRDPESFKKNRLFGHNVSHHVCLKGFLLPYRHPEIWHGLDVWLPDKYTGKSKLVLTVHDLVVFSHPEMLSPNYVKAIKKKFVRYFESVVPDAVIAISEQTAEEIKTYFPSADNRTYTVHQGVSDFWRPKESSHPFQERFKYFLFVSTLEPRKNFSAARKAFLELNMPGIKLVVVGKNNGEDQRLLGGKNIVWLGYCDREFIRTLYNHSLGLLFTSAYEGFGLPPLEALACNCPVIAENTLPCSKFLPPEFTVDSRDTEKMTEKMKALVDLKNRKKLHLVVKDLTWINTAKKTFEIYKKVLAN